MSKPQPGLLRTYYYRVFDQIPELAQAEEEFNTLVSRAEDLFLTILGGLPVSFGTEAHLQKILTACWLRRESDKNPLSRMGGPQIRAANPVADLRVILESSGLSPSEVSEWVANVRVLLETPQQESYVVNRYAMCRRDLPHITAKQVTDFVLKVNPDFFKISDVSGEEKEEDLAETAYNQVGRSLVSSIFGQGPKKDRSLETVIAQATLQYLDSLSTNNTTSREALPAILQKAGIQGDDFPKEILKGKPSSLNMLLRGHLSSQANPPLWDEKYRKTARKSCEKLIKESTKTQGEDLLWLTQFNFFGDTPQSTDGWAPILIAALSTVFSSVSLISNQEATRQSLITKARDFEKNFQKSPRAVEALNDYVNTRSKNLEEGTYDLKPRAITGWESLKKDFELTPSEEERIKIARETNRYRSKRGDVHLFEFLASDTAKKAGCWDIVQSYVNWVDVSTRVARTLVPKFQHKTKERDAWGNLPFGENAWTIKIVEDAEGKHVAHLYLFNDPSRVVTVNIRNKRANEELQIGSSAPPTVFGRHGSLGVSDPHELTLGEKHTKEELPPRPIVGSISFQKDKKGNESPKFKPLSKHSWILEKKHDRYYLRYAARIHPLKKYKKRADSKIVVGVDQGLRNPMAHATIRVLENEEFEKLLKENSLTPYTSHTKEGDVVIAYLGRDSKGKKISLRRVSEDKWGIREGVGTIHASGKDRKTSTEEHVFAINLGKRAGRRARIARRLVANQRSLVDSLRAFLNALNSGVRVIVRMRSSEDTRGTIKLWNNLCFGTDYKIRYAARRAWTRTFGEDPIQGQLPDKLPSQQRLLDSASTIEAAWRESEVDFKGYLDEVQQRIVPRQGAQQHRNAGGLSEDRLQTIRFFLNVLKAWESHATPETPYRRMAPGDYSENCQRIDRYLERKKEERQRQATAKLFQSISNPDILSIERLDMKGDQRNLRQKNRQGARLAPAKAKKFIMERAELEGVAIRDCEPSYTSQVDSQTGLPGMRFHMVSVVEFLERIEGLLKAHFSRSKAVNEEITRYLEGLYAQWDPSSKTWKDAKGTYVLESIVPRVRWKGPTQHPDHLKIPSSTGGIFCSIQDGKLHQFDADMNAAANVAIRSLTSTWRKFYPEGEMFQAQDAIHMKILSLLSTSSNVLY